MIRDYQVNKRTIENFPKYENYHILNNIQSFENKRNKSAKIKIKWHYLLIIIKHSKKHIRKILLFWNTILKIFENFES